MQLIDQQQQLIAMITEAIVGVLALYNFVAPYFNLPALVIGTEQITAIVTGLVMIGLLVYAGWRNHNITPESKLSQVVLDALKSGDLSEENVTEMLDQAEKARARELDELNAEIEREVNEFMDRQDAIEAQEAVEAKDGTESVEAEYENVD